MASLAQRLRERGVEIREVSVGSTPTALPCAAVPGVTEVRPGTYVYNDAMQIKYGLCSEAECSALLAVTVVSRPGPDLAIVDGGVKVFAAYRALWVRSLRYLRGPSGHSADPPFRGARHGRSGARRGSGRRRDPLLYP